MYLRFFSDRAKRLKRNAAVWLPATALFWLMPAFYVLELECFHRYPKYFFQEYLPHHIPVLVFDLILLYALFAAFFFLTKKAWLNILLFNALVLAVSLVNYLKYALTGENFMPHDIIMAANIGQIAGFASVKPEFWMALFFSASVFSVVFPGMFAKDAPFRFYARLPAASALLAALFAFFGNGDLSGDLFNKFGMYFESADNQTSNYKTNGFIGGFSINLASFAIKRPEGYSAARLREALGKYGEVPPAADFVSPDVVLVLSESFWDPRLLPGTGISPGPFENFDELSLRENAFAGKLVVPAYGGGTIRTEFEILTGLVCDALPDGVVPYNAMKKELESYVSHYKGLGYDAIALHPYLAKFYNRDRGLPLLGFDEYRAESLRQIEEVEWVVSGKNISDESLTRYLEYFLDEAEKKDGSPLFLFGISIENHQPYRNKYDPGSFSFAAENPYLDETDFHAFENFIQGVKNADEALGQLCGFIDSRKRPAVVVFFGDHLPAICSNYSAYLDTGFISDIYATDSRPRLYSTPFIIYSNFPLDKENLDGDAYASYDLLNVLSSLIGSGKTRYMGYLEALREELPYYNKRLGIEMTERQMELLKIQYYETYRRMTD